MRIGSPINDNVNDHSGDISFDVTGVQGRERQRQHEPIHQNVNHDSIKQSRHHG